MNKRAYIARILAISSYFIFIIFSIIFGFDPGKKIATNLVTFLLDMLMILPFAFILIGLFEVWVSREVIEKHLGENTGLRGHLWVVLLAGTTVGGLYIAFPIAYSLYSKGARLSIIFTYIGASAICRVPMAVFETSFMGLKFTVIRLLVSIPIVIITAELMGNYLTKKNYTIIDGSVG